MTAAVGVLTRDRPCYLLRAIESVREHLVDPGLVVGVWVYDDGSRFPLPLARAPWLHLERASVSRGVAHGKNRLLQAMLNEPDVEWAFLLEDDCEILNGRAVSGYLAACEVSGLEHLAFHGHGGLNLHPSGLNLHPSQQATATCQAITYWPNATAGWAAYSRRSIEDAGLFDEGFLNAYEHVEHSQRLAEHGFTSAWPLNADATGSEEWVAEQPGALDSSVIRRDPAWPAQVAAAKAYWRRSHPASYRRVFGEDEYRRVREAS